MTKSEQFLAIEEVRGNGPSVAAWKGHKGAVKKFSEIAAYNSITLVTRALELNSKALVSLFL